MNWSWLKTEYPFEQTTQEKVDLIFFVSIFASIIIVLLQPFGFTIINQAVAFFGFLCIGIVTLSVNYFGFPYFFPGVFDEKRWSILKAFTFLTYNFIIMGFYNHIFSVLVIKQNVFYLQSINDLLSLLFRTIAVGAIAAFFWILIKYNFLARKHLQISQDLNSRLKTSLGIKLAIQKNDEYIELQLENRLTSLQRNSIKYINTEGNYVTFYFKDKSSKLYRATLKNIETSLQDFPEFFRCHRSYIINLNAIESSIGNSQGLKVKIINENVKIPVARSKIKLLKQYYNQINK